MNFPLRFLMAFGFHYSPFDSILDSFSHNFFDSPFHGSFYNFFQILVLSC